jgi:hypothetical protein
MEDIEINEVEDKFEYLVQNEGISMIYPVINDALNGTLIDNNEIGGGWSERAG